MIKLYHFSIHEKNAVVTVLQALFGGKRLLNETIDRLESECERP